MLTRGLTALVLAVGCHSLSDDEVEVRPHGYYLPGFNMFFRQEDVLPSGDDKFWVCQGEALYVPTDPAEEEGQ